ncbi:uncharacterized protein BDZ83DRAFT_598727 [Colletotrichum acutatum]|uniref:PHD-type domain-containing protein n=1 Tax=Glomerella acutata TaxID=27357 RepID=A0AAD8XQ12_GLOAC|nr:uncharacterized protein BDZ83DRAFT_598727 [Colletotrichum acutatum]KAK1731309.1 hypothetical protein BDZ83DRAFT_598727 [Colletotrichum acutatum]
MNAMDDDGSREPPRKRLRSAQPTRRGRSRGARGGSVNPNTVRKELGELDRQPTEQQAQESESSIDPRALPIPAALERYKAWKEAGAQHDEFCFICRQTKGLTYCITCKRSYHDSCRPEESTHSVIEGNSCFFCEVCVHRNWHKDPPFLMPEMRPSAASLSSAAVEVAEATGATPSTKDTGRQDLSNSPQVHQNQETNRITEASKDTPSTAARRTRTAKASHSAAREEIAAAPSSSTTHTENTPLPPPATTTAAAATSRGEPPRSSSSTQRAPAARKSRYTTLPTDVDAALRLLYAELETAHELRHKVGDVEGQVAQMQRELHLRNSELALARRAADVGRVSASEMEQLRAQAALGQKAVEEADGLRAENRTLRAELAVSRERLVDSERALEEWKRKLSALMS